MIDDAELLRRYAAERSEAAFRELVHRHLDLVYSAALRRLRGDAHGAADVVQHVFVALARQAAALSRHAVLPAWLYATTRNVAIDHARAERRRKAREQEAHAMHELTSNSAPPADWEQLRPLLDEAMDELGDREREAVLLRFFARQPFAEIGRTLHLSEDAARMRVERALDKLRGLLGRRGVTSTAVALGLALSNHAVAAAPAGLGAAVASASSLTGPTIGFLQFMSASKLATGGTALVLALGFGAAGYEVHASRIAGVAHVAMQRDTATLAVRLREQRQRAEAAEQAANERQKALEAARAGQQRAARAAAAAVQQARLAEGEALMARHPEVRQALIEQRRAEKAGYYAPLLRSLRLLPAQVERFKDLSAQGETALLTGANGKPILCSVGGDRRQAEAELRILLGEDGFRQYKEWGDGGGAAFQTVIELGGTLYRTPSPLTAAQAETLQRILVEGRVAVDGSSRRHYDWDAILAQAKSFLSEAQIAALDYFQAQDSFDQALAQSRRSRLQSSGPTAPGK